jgi:hypothetical protein
MSNEHFSLNLGNFNQSMIEQRGKWEALKTRHVQISQAYELITGQKKKRY